MQMLDLIGSDWWIEWPWESLIIKQGLRVVFVLRSDKSHNSGRLLHLRSIWSCHQRSRWISNCAFFLFTFYFYVFLAFHVMVLLVFSASIHNSNALLPFFWYWRFLEAIYFIYLRTWKCWSSCYFFMRNFFYFIWGLLKFFSHKLILFLNIY